MARWIEHYVDLYSRENSVFQEALETIEDLPVLEELDAEPTIEELSKAIDALSIGKAPGDRRHSSRDHQMWKASPTETIA